MAKFECRDCDVTSEQEPECWCCGADLTPPEPVVLAVPVPDEELAALMREFGEAMVGSGLNFATYF